MVLCGMMFSVHVLIYAVTVDTSQSVHARQSFSVSSAVSDHTLMLSFLQQFQLLLLAWIEKNWL